MYRIEFSGCLTTIIFFLIILFLVKELWWLIVGIAVILIVLYYAKLIYNTISDKANNEKATYKPKMGEVYKVCPYCNTKVKITSDTCPVCKHALN